MLLHVPAQLGYGALFVLIFIECAGVPVPGETALLTAGVLAGTGRLSLPLVIAVAAAAAMLGDNMGYLVGRHGGRRLLLRGGPLGHHRRRAVERGEAFFERHGAKTVFIGRWIAGVRIAGAVLAGASAMPWRVFLLFNTLGAIAWAGTVASFAAYAGPVATGTLYVVGLVIAGGTFVAAWLARKRARV
jgi:membrane protein DedA with SNARE-associated domain